MHMKATKIGVEDMTHLISTPQTNVASAEEATWPITGERNGTNLVCIIMKSGTTHGTPNNHTIIMKSGTMMGTIGTMIWTIMNGKMSFTILTQMMNVSMTSRQSMATVTTAMTMTIMLIGAALATPQLSIPILCAVFAKLRSQCTTLMSLYMKTRNA